MNISEIITQAERSVLAVTMAKERAACGAWDEPITPADYLMWWEDEVDVQTDQADFFPDEYDERMRYAIILKKYANKLRVAGVIPSPKPWEQN